MTAAIPHPSYVFSLQTPVQFANRSAAFWQFASIVPQDRDGMGRLVIGGKPPGWEVLGILAVCAAEFETSSIFCFLSPFPFLCGYAMLMNPQEVVKYRGIGRERL